MGRKSKLPVIIQLDGNKDKDIFPNDGLPILVNYVDVPHHREKASNLTRVFLMNATAKDIENTVAMRSKLGKGSFSVISAEMPYMHGQSLVTPTIFQFCIDRGLSASFATVIVRLYIKYLLGKQFASNTIRNKLKAMKGFIEFIVSVREKPQELGLSDLDKDLWRQFLDHVALNCPNPKEEFNEVRSIFNNYEPTSLNGWLVHLKARARKIKTSSEHSSEIADSSYSDAVMYQMLALFLEGFQRRIGYLKRYESLTPKDMPTDWLYPGRDNKKSAELSKPRNAKGIKYETESYRLLYGWLNGGEEGYQIIIDHYLIHHKAGVITKSGAKYIGGMAASLQWLVVRHEKRSRVGHELRQLLLQFYQVTATWHGFTYPTNSRTIWQYYLNKKTADEPNLVINQIAWCLANILMMQTGINREVALSIPSLGEDGKSILERGDPLFIGGKDNATEIELFGFKERGGRQRSKIQFAIVKSSPIYQMLLEYERFVKVSNSGPFFEINKKFSTGWSRAGGIQDFKATYPVLDDDGLQLSSIHTSKFRKVFASAQLLDHIGGVTNPSELAQKLRDDLHHGNLDTTLSHYLLKSNIGRSVIDAAIVTITNEKLIEAIHFKGKVNLSEQTTAKKKVFLCDCEDPLNPSHNVSIAEECKHYDLCLGCERSIITKFHLPYICARILQYENERKTDPHIWPAIFENHWSIANDALDQYKAKDKNDGIQLVNEAWAMALEGKVTLPPIFNSSAR